MTDPFSAAEIDWRSFDQFVETADHFELFGLPRGYAIDEAELRRRFLAISRRIHPDALADRGDEAQAAAMRISARVNLAYETLRDPIRRAEYVLERSGGKSAAQDKRVPQEVLNQTLMLREEIEEAKASGDQATLSAIRKGVLAQKAAGEAKIVALAQQLAANPTDADRDALRLALNAMKYVGNLLGQL